MDSFYRNKNIIVTGASSGIGRVCAIKLAEHGANVILMARDHEKLTSTYNSLVPGKHLIKVHDVTNFNETETIIEEIVAELGQISGFVHCAGIEKTIPLKNMSPSIYDEIYKTNVVSALELCKYITKKKNIAPNGASIVFISSIMGLLGQPGLIAYCSSKAALLGATKAMALELANKKIRVNAILPGMIETEMTKQFFSKLPEESVKEIIKKYPLGLGQPEDVAELVLFLLSDKAKWITGSEFIVDGGYHAL